MAAETQYTANTGMVTISTANSNLDGTGTLGTVLTAASNGTYIRSINIKAQQTTTQGMIRLFVDNGTSVKILAEIIVHAVTQAGTHRSFEKIVNLNYNLKSGCILKVSTEKAETFNIIAEGLDWAYYASSVRYECTLFTTTSNSGFITLANGNLNGTGERVDLLTVGAAASGWKGAVISKITIKSTQSTTRGMVRLFIVDTSSNVKLMKEVEVPAVTPSSVSTSFNADFTFNNGFNLSPGFTIQCSTQNTETFAVTVDAMGWKYPT